MSSPDRTWASGGGPQRAAHARSMSLHKELRATASKPKKDFGRQPLRAPCARAPPRQPHRSLEDRQQPKKGVLGGSPSAPRARALRLHGRVDLLQRGPRALQLRLVPLRQRPPGRRLPVAEHLCHVASVQKSVLTLSTPAPAATRLAAPRCGTSARHWGSATAPEVSAQALSTRLAPVDLTDTCILIRLPDKTVSHIGFSVVWRGAGTRPDDPVFAGAPWKHHSTQWCNPERRSVPCVHAWLFLGVQHGETRVLQHVQHMPASAMPPHLRGGLEPGALLLVGQVHDRPAHRRAERLLLRERRRRRQLRGSCAAPARLCPGTLHQDDIRAIRQPQVHKRAAC